jgi:solute carrier family 39 (zinc transporter), member 1/2/3
MPQQQQTPARTSTMIRFSPRHAKGVWTLSLVLLAESVTFGNAVSFWSKFQQQQQKPFFAQQQQTTTSKKTTTASSGAEKSPVFAPLSQATSTEQQQQGSCDASSSPSLFSDSRSRIEGMFHKSKPPPHRRSDRDNDYCCQHCTGCLWTDDLTARSVARLCRGGHVHHHHGATAAVLDAVTPLHLPLNAWKVILQFFLTALNVACWLIPLKSKRISENRLGLSLANAFSGGVFLSLAFGHLIPECLHGFENSAYNEATPFLLVLGGYLLIFFVEKVAFDAHDILHEMVEHGPERATSSSGTDVRGGHGHHHHHHPTPPVPNGTTTTTAASSGRSAVILLGALAVHSILEMMALGLSNSFSDCALLTLSISLHQPAESIALLVAFLKSGLSHGQIIRYLSIFSCMGPIGVGLGMLVNQFAAPIVDSILLAVVAGTFVYVGATEVIPEEWEDSTHKWKKFAALMSGIVSILAITQYTMTLGQHAGGG